MGILIKGTRGAGVHPCVYTIVLDKTNRYDRQDDARRRRAEPDVDRAELLRLAGALEDASEHPIAQAIAKGATQGGRRRRRPPSSRTSRAGACVASSRAAPSSSGASRCSPTSPSPSPPGWPPRRRGRRARARPSSRPAFNGAARGLLVVADTVKPTSAEAVAQLRRLGLTVVLLTATTRPSPGRSPLRSGSNYADAEVLPKDKVDVVVRLQKEGKVVAMVGRRA